MDQGRIAEFASPAELLRDQKSQFYAVHIHLIWPRGPADYDFSFAKRLVGQNLRI